MDGFKLISNQLILWVALFGFAACGDATSTSTSTSSSTDASLSGLTISAGRISPEFAVDITEYTL